MLSDTPTTTPPPPALQKKKWTEELRKPDQQQQTSLSVFRLQWHSLQEEDACRIHKNIKSRQWFEHSHGSAIEHLSNVVTIGVLQANVFESGLNSIGSTLVVLV